jgi:cytoskeletal protein RodZ
LFLKLDADALVDAYKASYEPRAEEAPLIRTEVANQRRTPTSVERKKKRVRRHQRGYALAAAIAIIIVALLAWFGTSRGNDHATIDADNISTSTVSTVTSTVSTAGSGGTSSTDTTDKGGASTSTTSDDGVSATVSTSTQSTTQGDTEDTSGGNVKMVLKVMDQNCWLVVREDSEQGAELYAGLLSKGGQQTFDSARRYWLNVGQPEVLTVTVGAKSYSLAAPAGAFVVTEAGVERSQ